MKRAWFLNSWPAVFTPLIFFGLTYLLLGFYYETNDDIFISLLLRGIAIQPASGDLVLYFHGIGNGLALLYEKLPQWPWYGLVLYTLLYVATVLAFLFLQRSAWQINRRWYVYLLLFFLTSWVEHIYLFNYMRVPLLLAAISYLLLLKLPEHKNKWLLKLCICLLFLLALCIRPSAALLGLAVVWPALFLFTTSPVFTWSNFRPLLLFAGIGAVFLLFLTLTQTPAQKQYQRLDWLKSTVLDFEIYEPQPRNQSDALALHGITLWFIADRTIINEAFYKRNGSISLTYIISKVAPRKIPVMMGMLVRDHFLVLVINIFLILFLLRSQKTDSALNRKLFLTYQFYFWLLILIIGIYLKLPPRVITPCLSLYTLINGALFLQHQPSGNTKNNLGRVAGLILIVLIGLQLFKIMHRVSWQQNNREVNEALIAKVANSFKKKILVTNVLPDYFRSLSPFRNYGFGSNTIFFLTGWQTLDPVNQLYAKKLTGETDFARAVQVLSRNKNTVWVMSPEFYEFLQAYFRTFYGQNINLKPRPDLLKKDHSIQIYRSGSLP